MAKHRTEPMLDNASMPAQAPTLVEVKGVSVRFGRRQVLSHVDLAVAKGEIVTVIGPNGSGKSTLLRALLGLIKPNEGSVQTAPDVTVGYVPQQLAIDPVLPLTVRRFLGLPRPQPETAVRAALAEVGAELLIDQAVQALSGGETQRVLLARALLRDPDLLVLDEPLASVDFRGQIDLFNLITEVRKRRGCGVLVVSHDLHLVMAGTDRVICLNQHVCCSGKPDAVSQHPEFLALFGPKAADSLAVYSHHHDHHHDLSGAAVPDSKHVAAVPDDAPQPAGDKRASA